VNPVPFRQVVTPLVTVVLTNVSDGQAAFHFILNEDDSDVITQSNRSDVHA